MRCPSAYCENLRKQFTDATISSPIGWKPEALQGIFVNSIVPEAITWVLILSGWQPCKVSHNSWLMVAVPA